MNKKDIKSIAYLLKQAKEKDKPKPIIFLGAGASISAGIPGANSIKDDILERFRDKPEIINLKEDQRTYYELMKCLNTTERHELLRGYITDEKVKINVSHIYLANLLALGYVDYILTVNFDDLLLRACAVFNFLPPVYDIAILKDFTTTTLQEKSVTYLHGQHNGFWLLNTKEELDKVHSSVPKVLNRICHGRTWIIIGYSGEDPIFNHIANLGRFDNDLFWIGYKENEPIEQVKNKILNKPNTNAYWVKGYDADSFFLKLHSELKLETPEIFNKPFSFLKSVVDKIIDIENRDHYKEVSERLELTKQIIGKAIQSFEDKEEPVNMEALTDEISLNRLKQEIIEKIVKKDYNTVGKIEEKVKELDDKQLAELLSALYYDWGIALYELAILKGDESLFKESFEKYKNATELNPNYVDAFNNWGIALSELAILKGDESLFKESFEKFEKAIELNPEYAFAFNNWGNALLELAKLKREESLFKESFEKYKHATKLDANVALAFNNWGNALLELAKLKREEPLFKESFEKYKNATELNPKYADAFLNWGTALSELAILKGDESLFKESFEKYKNTTELNPEFAFAFYNWGNALSKLAILKRGEYLFDESFKKFEKATELNSLYAPAFNNWGTSLFELAKLKEDKILYKESIKKFEKATELNPKNADAFNNWGNALSGLAKLEKDKTMFKQ